VLKSLIAEDDLMIADMVKMLLVDAGYEVCGIARTVTEAVALIRRHKPDLAVIDVRLADDDLGTDIGPIGRPSQARRSLCHRQCLGRGADRRRRPRLPLKALPFPRPPAQPGDRGRDRRHRHGIAALSSWVPGSASGNHQTQ